MSLYIMTTNQVAQMVETAVKEAPSIIVVQVLGTLDPFLLRDKTCVLDTDEAAAMVKEAIEHAPTNKVVEALELLKDYLKCDNTPLYPCGYQKDEKVYHFGRCDGLE